MANRVLNGKAEVEQARALAARYHFDFVDLNEARPDRELLRTIPLDLMVRYEFLPLEATAHQLVVAMSDPTGRASRNWKSSWTAE